MFGSSMLDIAIGVIFVYLLLSVFATAINEIILSAINMRGKELLQGVKTLLNEEGPDNPLSLVTKIYNHGQICGLYKGHFDVSAPDLARQTSKHLPSYIPSRNFALALLETVKEHPAALTTSAADPSKSGDEKKAADLALANAQAAIADIQKAALQTAQDAAAKAQQAANNPVASVAAVTVALQNTVTISQALCEGAAAMASNKSTEKVGKPLVSMIRMADNDAHKLQKAVEDWYNSAMDRVSGWYKHRTQKVLFTIGIIMAVALNANTVNIVRQLSKDSTLRQSIVAAAQSAKPPAANAAPSMQAQIQAAQDSVGSISNLGLPLGWRSIPNFRALPQRLHSPHFLAISLDRIFGWLLTAVAISLGAPFWFDTLNKIMVVRSTVKPREKSQDEPSKS